ncbi:MAG TPA: large conductance mechanosensitive channel protein MscL [Ktedonobacteraceae bacterium]
MSTTDQRQHNWRNEFGHVTHYAKDTLGGFRTFILRGNVVDLAIGIVIGAAFTSVVNSLVGNIITPLIPVPGTSLAGLKWQVPYAGKPDVVINLGAFINAVLSFVIVAAVLYFFIVRPVAALMTRYNPPVVTAPETRDCPYCLQSIPLQATRCAFCTSPLPPATDAEAAPVQRSGREA